MGQMSPRGSNEAQSGAMSAKAASLGTYQIDISDVRGGACREPKNVAVTLGKGSAGESQLLQN